MYTLSLSYGKDSLACLGAIEQLGWPLDRIVHAEVWATDTIPADLPPMVEFKKKADRILKERWGIEVEHVCATKRERVTPRSLPQRKRTYENTMYEQHERGKHIGQIRGFPMCRGGWCQDRLKGAALDLAAKANLRGHLLQGSEASPERERERDIYGFPMVRGQWCNSALKKAPLELRGGKPSGVNIVRENSNEPVLRISNLGKPRELVYPAQDQCFLPAPCHRAQTKIL